MSTVINGLMLAEKVKESVAEEVAAIKKQGGKIALAVVLVGDNASSIIYVNNKKRECEKIGIDFTLHKLPEDVSQKTITDLISKLSKDKDVNGILLQLPLPNINDQDQQQAINMIDPSKDVDGLTTHSMGQLVRGEEAFVPCTAAGILYAINSVCPDVAGKNIVVVGRSQIVGKPVSLLLLNNNATVSICHSKTKNLKEHTSNADIVICAVGKAKMITADMVKKDAIVIDVGINRLDDGSLAGDVNFDELADKVSAITPVPRGIGPLTIAFLLRNIVRAYKIQHGL